MSEQKNKFNPNEIIEFEKDYFEILGINRENFPQGTTHKDKKEVAKILAEAYRNKAKIHHPDRGGSVEKFKEIVRAHTVLSDEILRKIYMSGKDYNFKFAEDFHASIDWDTLGEYRKGTLADSIGFSLFYKISERKKDYQLIPAAFPKEESDNYVWDWVIDEILDQDDRLYKICLSLVHDEEDVLRLTSGEDLEESLPFKIYMCIPRANIYFLRSEPERFYYDDGTYDEFRGRLQAASYSDINLLETTKLEEAEKFIETELFSLLEKFRSGDLVKEQIEKDREAAQVTWVNTKKAQDIDLDMLKEILRMKSRESLGDAKPNPLGSNFLKNFSNDVKHKSNKALKIGDESELT